MLDRGMQTCQSLQAAWPCRALQIDWFSSGPSGLGAGNVVSDTFVQWLSSGEECKWGLRTGTGAMGDELAGRKDRQR
jgi:hypothetical protein